MGQFFLVTHATFIKVVFILIVVEQQRDKKPYPI